MLSKICRWPFHDYPQNTWRKVHHLPEHPRWGYQIHQGRGGSQQDYFRALHHGRTEGGWLLTLFYHRSTHTDQRLLTTTKQSSMLRTRERVEITEVKEEYKHINYAISYKEKWMQDPRQGQAKSYIYERRFFTLHKRLYERMVRNNMALGYDLSPASCWGMCSFIPKTN